VLYLRGIRVDLQMSERCLTTDYSLRGREDYEIWVDGSRNGDYPNWWLTGGHKPGWVITQDDFDPPLTAKEIRQISEYCYDRMSGA
jgi:hypothetical protein